MALSPARASLLGPLHFGASPAGSTWQVLDLPLLLVAASATWTIGRSRVVDSVALTKTPEQALP
jgi:hypothetical protein